MKANRLTILLAVMIVLGVGRFAWSPAEKQYAKAEPVKNRTLASPSRSDSVSPAQKADEIALRETASRGDDVPGNAFPVRSARVLPTAPVLAPIVAASPPVASVPAAPPAPPPPPFQVIGTYDDGGPPAVFISTSSGTLIARPGNLLLAEYRVTGITRNQVALLQTSTQRTIELPVPGAVR